MNDQANKGIRHNPCGAIYSPAVKPNKPATEAQFDPVMVEAMQTGYKRALVDALEAWTDWGDVGLMQWLKSDLHQLRWPTAMTHCSDCGEEVAVRDTFKNFDREGRECLRCHREGRS